ncbi:ScyD/ScyE family protein [Terracoccus sp. 273MFTsu3.1]|uniref:ScyD/ScyE family protein n=1 Tax=Terracoccus sp. 273MFTsu3.1 TaxID=1172188 RepID=UPI0018C97D24|nr:ScyD/ScyE family protein [Terracoccus sp. 273MFTsu3.1]
MSSHMPKVIASGLNSPRQLAFSPSGALYVAEAGTTGTTACRPNPIDPTTQACVGLTGSVARIGAKGSVKRVVTGLSSAGGTADALGPADLVFTGEHTFALTMGLGGSPDYRDSFGPQGANLGKLLKVELKDHGKARVTSIADLARFEQRKNPDGTDVDSDPTGLARSGKGFVYTDSGGNSVNAVRKHVSNVAVLPPVLTTVASPVGPPAGFPADAVPTDVVKGPDGAWYVSQLVGFPFEKGSAAIWRIKPGHAPTKWATGLTNVTSLAFDKEGHLYAVEIASNGLASPPPIGALVRVRPHSTSPTVVTGGLFMPYGLALRGDYAYVTTHATDAGGGQVVRIHL